METIKASTDWSDQFPNAPSGSGSPEPSSSIEIRRGRKQSLFLHTIDYLSQQFDSFGNTFQPCLEDLLYLYGGDRKRTDHVIKVLKRKELLMRVNVELENQSKPKYLPNVLTVSKKGAGHLHNLRKNGLTQYEEWQEVQPRIKKLLKAPQLLFFDQRNVSFFQTREIVRMALPFLPSISGLDYQFIAKIVAFNKSKVVSTSELCQQIFGFIEVLLRLQGDYIPNETLWQITKTLENHGLRINLTKRKLYPHIQVGARLFGANRNLQRKEPFYRAVEKALDHYYEKFAIEKSAREQITVINKRLKEAERIALDPEARALGMIGFIVPGFFLDENRKQYPLVPEMWLAGRDQMHQIRKLYRKLAL